jgi:HrpA-like RNA helicase
MHAWSSLSCNLNVRSFHPLTGNVGVTQPRRVAATSTAARVAAELGTPLGQMVGYQVRLRVCICVRVRVRHYSICQHSCARGC